MLPENKKHWGVEGMPDPTAGAAIERADKERSHIWREIQFTVPGDPTGKARPRFSGGHAYNTEKTRAYEEWVRTCCVLDCKKRLPEYAGDVEAVIRAYYPIPKSAGKMKRQRMLEGKIRPVVKPDLDNVAKSILDALNGIAYQDDNKITDLGISKWYSDAPRVEVAIRYRGE